MQTLKLKVKRLGINGEGIAYFKKTIVFIPGALPKEEVLVKITKNKKNFMEAQLLKILKASKDRSQPFCPIYETCGGCQLQHLKYSKQLTYKEDIIKQALKRFKPQGYENFEVRSTLGMKSPIAYRNKLQFQIRENQSQLKMGLFKPDSHQLVDIADCPIQDPLTQKIANVCLKLFKKYHIRGYNEKTHQGLMKTLMVRVGKKTKEAQVVFITTEKKIPRLQYIINDLIKECPNIVSIMQNINHKKTSLIMGEETICHYGKSFIDEKLDDLTFHLSARAFFQLNPVQTEVLYDQVRKALKLQENDVVIDAYCGVGTIGLSLASTARHVYGMDTIEAAIKDARQAAKLLDINNTTYEVGAAEDLLPKWLDDDIKPNAIVVDPPRTGLDKKLIQALLKHKIPKLVYVSCNASTLARDLVSLVQDYDVNYIQSVDMFPHTARVEAVVSLQLRK